MGSPTAQPSAYAYAGRVVQSNNGSPRLKRVGPMLLCCRDTLEGKDMQSAGTNADTPLPLLPNEAADLKLNSSDRLALASHSSVPGSSTHMLTTSLDSGTAFKYSCPRCQKTVKFDGFCMDCVSSSQ